VEYGFEFFFFLGNKTHLLVLVGEELWLMIDGLRSESFEWVYGR
jgi:hypothetical protein